MKFTHLFTLLSLAFIFLTACKKDSPNPQTGAYTLEHKGLITPLLPTDNLLTHEGIALGQQLFYEKDLSKDGSLSCASCHLQEFAFADTSQFSMGVDGLLGKRQAMAIFNMAWNNNEFFWDGRAHLLRDQALLPIQDPLEMNETLDNVIEKLKQKPAYVESFDQVFNNTGINALNISLALEQFMLSIVSNRSKYDKFLAQEVSLSAAEERGRRLFFSPFDPDNSNTSGANCSVCHGGSNFENDSYMNNGLDTPEEMTDIGREQVTGNPLTRGNFKVPSLRNIALTPPYMHDGRFKTLEEVIEHYDHQVEFSPSLSPTLQSIQLNNGLGLSAQDKSDLIAFLKTLSDHELTNDSRYADPF